MKISIILFCLILTTFYSKAQLLLGAGGGHQTNATSQLQWSLGESIIGYSANNAHSFSIGYQQPITIEIVGLEDKEILAGITLYPNPFLEYVFVEIPEKMGRDYTLAINQVNGKTLDVNATNEGKRIKIDTSTWASGVYLLRIIHNQKTFSAKLVKP